ncbi:MAG: aminoacyl-tRNA hydrolase [Clostridiales Family XIII bacterium]|jgi:PTH1 family peptidyl-tRNA hydrolase|nr:aminoacyl-tRNA hydrolase [Clostridiales Family XIII bacterium]
MEQHIIVGLGNPGRRYAGTRHNLGFAAVDLMAERCGIKVSRLRFKALIGEGTAFGSRVLLVKPQTYMNLSGESVAAVMAYYKAPPEALAVVYDDVDIPLGRIRIRKQGSAGTHNGMRSIVYHLRRDDFPRVRIGIGGEVGARLTDYVIGGFRRQEMDTARDAVMRAVLALECMLLDGVDAAMNRYNADPDAAARGAGGRGPEGGADE